MICSGATSCLNPAVFPVGEDLSDTSNFLLCAEGQLQIISGPVADIQNFSLKSGSKVYNKRYAEISLMTLCANYCFVEDFTPPKCLVQNQIVTCVCAGTSSTGATIKM